MNNKTEIKWAIRADLPRILEIEFDCFDRPWSKAAFQEQMDNRNTLCLVIRSGGIIVGFCVYELKSDYIYVSNFAICRYERYQGFGRLLVERLKRKLSGAKRKLLRLEIREDNLGGQLFFQKQGFKCTRIVRRPYDDLLIDGYEMEYPVPVAETVEAV